MKMYKWQKVQRHSELK